MISDTTFLALTEVAQTAKGPVWRSYDYGDINSSYSGDVENIQLATDMSSFSSENATMEINGDWVSFKYLFQDFEGISLRPAGWEMSTRTSCQRFDVVNVSSNDSEIGNVIHYQNDREGDTNVLQLATANYTEFPMRLYGSRYRWIVIHEVSIDDGPLKKRATEDLRGMMTDICELQSPIPIDCDFKLCVSSI